MQPCNAITDRKTCLTSNDSRSAYDFSPCAYCPNGPCTGNNDNRCEPKTWLQSQGIDTFEDCFEGANGYTVARSVDFVKTILLFIKIKI